MNTIKKIWRNLTSSVVHSAESPVDPSPVIKKFFSAKVLSMSTTHFTLMVDENFWPTSISIPHEVAEHFYITDIKINKNSQFINPSCLPALVFSDRASPVELDLDPLQKSSCITISVVNTSTFSAQTFEYLVRGTRIPPHPNVPKRVVVGLGSTQVQPRGSLNVSVQLVDETKLSRLIVPSSIADHFTIHSIRTSTTLQQLSPQYHLNEPTPAAEYAEHKSCLTDLAICVEKQGFVTISAENITDAPRNFSGAFVGQMRP